MQTSIILMYCLGATLSESGKIKSCKDQGKIPMPSIEVCEQAAHDAQLHGKKHGLMDNKTYCMIIQEI